MNAHLMAAVSNRAGLKAGVYPALPPKKERGDVCIYPSDAGDYKLWFQDKDIEHTFNDLLMRFRDQRRTVRWFESFMPDCKGSDRVLLGEMAGEFTLHMDTISERTDGFPVLPGIRIGFSTPRAAFFAQQLQARAQRHTIKRAVTLLKQAGIPVDSNTTPVKADREGNLSFVDGFGSVVGVGGFYSLFNDVQDVCIHTARIEDVSLFSADAGLLQNAVDVIAHGREVDPVMARIYHLASRVKTAAVHVVADTVIVSDANRKEPQNGAIAHADREYFMGHPIIFACSQQTMRAVVKELTGITIK